MYLYANAEGTQLLAKSLGQTGIDTAHFTTDVPNITFAISADDLKVVEGTEGDDILTGTSGVDIFYGYGGDDTFSSLAGADIIDGGAGTDQVNYLFSSAITIDLSVKEDGYATGSGGEADGDKLKNIENIFGSTGNDILTGDEKANELTGSGGNDELYGGDGDDTLIGSGGDDTLTGGSGKDTLTGGDGASGGGGADTFIIGSLDGDIITDFTPAEGDKITLDGALADTTTIYVAVRGDDTYLYTDDSYTEAALIAVLQDYDPAPVADGGRGPITTDYFTNSGPDHRRACQYH